MAKIQPSLKLKLDILDEDGKVTKTFNVTYRDLNKRELRKVGESNKEIMDLFSKAKTLASSADTLNKKIEALKDEGDSNGVIKTAEKLEKIYKDQDAIDAKFEELGGYDKLLEASKATFEIAVGGSDKEALAEFAENELDYGQVLDALAEDAKDSRGKQR
ncbi:hypothetical protein PF327_10780 [Sulfurovum sp. XTW-4]|uniref:Uncharacterized protein n=1 Tax=Sulfurovum xiamenensis TaxID=3019066 RepID=A0ABT7QVV3_9BACT|nr:hypothetical protein [Sulfurovum xiamenensis]MDM5264679.1 hypothetical protein [Sulfurovum xiamenensis]